MSRNSFEAIKAMEWSLNFSSNAEATVAEFVKNYIKDSDVIVFVEVVKNTSALKLMEEMSHYNFYESQNSIGNQVIIAIKKEILVTNIVTRIPNVSDNNSPNFLQVEIMINSIKYQIIGTRIRIGATPSEFVNGKYKVTDEDEIEDYINRKRQFEILSNYISGFENVIILGDFNNSYIQAKLSDEYRSVKYLYAQKTLTKYYNYHIIKDMIQGEFKIHTPPEGMSWGLQYIVETQEYQFGYIKNDHLITSKNISVKNINYNWDFVKNDNSFYPPFGKINSYGKQGVDIKKGVPDHAILRVELQL